MKEDQSNFWTFSLAVYDDSAVRKECLDLQDRYGINVSLLLFCAFVGAVRGAVLSDQDLKQAAGVVDAWHENIVTRLRKTRLALRPSAKDPSPVASEALRESVKAVELEAERLEQTMLERWASSRADTWQRAQPVEAVEANIRMLLATAAERAQWPSPPSHLIAAALEARRSILG